jgi:CHAT domain-containing protein
LIRLAVSRYGAELEVRLEHGTLSHKEHIPFDEARVLDRARDLVAALARGNRSRKLTQACLKEMHTVGEELYRALLPESTRADLARAVADEAAPLLLQLDEGLVAVPWELLFDGERFLCQRFDVGRAVFTRQKRRTDGGRPAPRQVAKVLVLASDPRGDLPSVDAEANAVVRALEVRDGLGVRHMAARSVAYVREHLKEFDVVHFAGHADYDRADPASSGWLLEDGKLTARDVAELAGGRAMPLLVFANSCQSSHEESWHADDPGRVFGLANAFLLAGVTFYLGTQWEVVDAQSHSFAAAFYAELARGRSIGASVRRARQTVIVQEGEGRLGWAGYVLYGDPSFVPLPTALKKHPEVPTALDLKGRESIRGIYKRTTDPRMAKVPVKRLPRWIGLAALALAAAAVAAIITIALR